MAFFEVDQSGKWELTGNTAIGVAGAKEFSLLVPSNVKQRVQKRIGNYYQEKNRAKSTHHIRMFTYCLFLALKKIIRKGDVVTIDEEYDGQGDRIRDLLLHLFERFEEKLDEKDIRFARVGRACKAHSIAKQTFLGTRDAEIVVGESEFYNLLDKTVEIRQKAFNKRMNDKHKKKAW